MSTGKLTDEQIMEAQSLREQGETYKAIGERFGVTLPAIRYWTLPGVREHQLARQREYQRERRASDPEYRERVNANRRRRRASDPEYRERVNANQRRQRAARRDSK